MRVFLAPPGKTFPNVACRRQGGRVDVLPVELPLAGVSLQVTDSERSLYD